MTKAARIVRSEVKTDYRATIDLARDATVRVDWWTDSGTTIAAYRDTGWMPAGSPSTLRGPLDSRAFRRESKEFNNYTTTTRCPLELACRPQIGRHLAVPNLRVRSEVRFRCSALIPLRYCLGMLQRMLWTAFRCRWAWATIRNGQWGITAYDAVEDAQWLCRVAQAGSRARCSPQNCAATQ